MRNSMLQEKDLIEIIEDAKFSYIDLRFMFVAHLKVREYETRDNNKSEINNTPADLPKISEVYHLFEQYPITLHNDWEDFASIQNQSEDLELEFPLPIIMCEPPQDAKSRIFLEFIYRGGLGFNIYDLSSSANRTANKIIEAFKEVANYSNEFPHLYLQMAAIYYRVKSACLWFDYLDKK